MVNLPIVATISSSGLCTLCEKTIPRVASWRSNNFSWRLSSVFARDPSDKASTCTATVGARLLGRVQRDFRAFAFTATCRDACKRGTLGWDGWGGKRNFPSLVNGKCLFSDRGDVDGPRVSDIGIRYVKVISMSWHCVPGRAITESSITRDPYQQKVNRG